MRCEEQAIESGQGVWYWPVEFTLSRVTETWYARHSAAQRSRVQFAMTYRLEGMAPTFRLFESEAVARQFLADSISDPRPADATLEPVVCRGLTPSLKGKVLVAVEFVSGYVWFDLGGPLSMYVLPEVRREGSVLEPADSSYRPALSALVGQRVVEHDHFLDDGVVIRFESTELRWSPETIRTYEGPEVMWGDSAAVMTREPPYD